MDAKGAQAKKRRKAAAGQKEMLLPVSSKRPPREAKNTEKPAASRARKRA
jgi:DNA end-binding protein Ku